MDERVQESIDKKQDEKESWCARIIGCQWPCSKGASGRAANQQTGQEKKKDKKEKKNDKEVKIETLINNLVTCTKCHEECRCDDERHHKCCDHDHLIDLAKLLIDEEKIGLPALGWKDDNQFLFESDESHEGREFTGDLRAKLAFFLGSTDIEFFSNRDFQVRVCDVPCRRTLILASRSFPGLECA